MFYLGVTNPHRVGLGVWACDDNQVTRVGQASSVTLNPGEDARAGIVRVLSQSGGGELTFYVMKLAPGEFYPRMARPCELRSQGSHALNPDNIAQAAVLASTRGQLVSLVRRLDTICQTIQPEGRNLDAYGHEVRNLLLVACTEVEMQWVSILRENSVVRTRYTTNDYVKLCEPMRLADYEISFPVFPWLPAVRPFQAWVTTDPTGSLSWYQAYNETKHDREKHFASSTVQSAFDSVAACAVMLAAQFGLTAVLDRGELREFLRFSNLPTWPLEEVYTPSAQLIAVPYPF